MTQTRIAIDNYQVVGFQLHSNFHQRLHLLVHEDPHLHHQCDLREEKHNFYIKKIG